MSHVGSAMAIGAVLEGVLLVFMIFKVSRIISVYRNKRSEMRYSYDALREAIGTVIRIPFVAGVVAAEFSLLRYAVTGFFCSAKNPTT